MSYLTIEVMKLRRSRVVVFTVALSVVVVLWTSMSLGSQVTVTRFHHQPADAWAAHLIGYVMGSALLSPLQLSLLASRVADMEHLGGGWRLNAIAGLRPGALLRVKFLLCSGLLAVVKASEMAAVVLIPRLVGAPANPHLSTTLVTGLGLLGTSMALVGVFLSLAAMIESQLVVLAAGIVGGFCGMAALLSPAWLTLINPFGYYAALTPFTFTTTGPIAVSPHWWAWLGYLGLSAALFLSVSHHFTTRDQ